MSKRKTTQMTRKIFCIIVLIMLAVNYSHAARSTAKLSLSPASNRVDTTAPLIKIISPEINQDFKYVYKEPTVTVTGRATDDNGVVSVAVNGAVARLNEKGEFSADILLKPGDNQIEIVALDTYKNKGVERFTLRRQSDLITSLGGDNRLTGSKGSNYALIIGINKYLNIPRLNSAVNDAEEIAQVLTNNYDFKSIVLLDDKATRSAILKELNFLKNKLTLNDRMIIYYAGHGWHDEETDTSYWLPVDADMNETTNWLDAKTVSDQLKRSAALQILIIADSCYAGTISRSFDPKLSSQSDNRESYLNRLMTKPSRVLIASGGNEPVKDSGGSNHSIFADVLIRSLKEPFSDRFTAEELMLRHIKEPVTGRSNQTPEYKVIRNSGHDGGDFVFVKSK